MLKKILVVEDNEINLRLYTVLLQRMDIDIKVAKTGTEALQLIRSYRPDLVILDIQIPEINGIEVAKQVRLDHVFDPMKIIAVTAYSMIGDRQKILDAGCDYYLAKPIDTRTFPKILQEILNGTVLTTENLTQTFEM